jgi:hypothetical protein
MNSRTILARLNELDQQICGTFGIPRSCDGTTLDEVITMSAATTERLLSGEGGVREAATSPLVGASYLTEFLQAQVEARVTRDAHEGNVVRALTEGIRRMKKAGSLQGLGRQACAELRDVLGFDSALLSFVEDDGFVVEKSDHGFIAFDCVTPSARMTTCPRRPTIAICSVPGGISWRLSSSNPG